MLGRARGRNGADAVVIDVELDGFELNRCVKSKEPPSPGNPDGNWSYESQTSLKFGIAVMSSTDVKRACFFSGADGVLHFQDKFNIQINELEREVGSGDLMFSVEEELITLSCSGVTVAALPKQYIFHLLRNSLVSQEFENKTFSFKKTETFDFSVFNSGERKPLQMHAKVRKYGFELRNLVSNINVRLIDQSSPHLDSARIDMGLQRIQRFIG